MSSLLADRPTTQFAGSTLLTQVFSSEEILAARHGQEELMLGRWNREPQFAWPRPLAKKARSWKTPYTTWFRSELEALARSPRLLNRIAEQTGAQRIRFWFDQLLWESPAQVRRERNFHWHTERSRWKTCDARLMVTAWVPLTRMSPEMGPIIFLPGSEKRRWTELPDGWEPEEKKLRATAAQPGDAALFCWHTVHGNPPNWADSPRRAIALHFAIDELAYKSCGRFRHLNERFVGKRRNEPNFSDESVCPLVWSTKG